MQYSGCARLAISVSDLAAWHWKGRSRCRARDDTAFGAKALAHRTGKRTRSEGLAAVERRYLMTAHDHMSPGGVGRSNRRHRGNQREGEASVRDDLGQHWYSPKFRAGMAQSKLTFAEGFKRVTNRTEFGRAEALIVFRRLP